MLVLLYTCADYLNKTVCKINVRLFYASLVLSKFCTQKPNEIMKVISGKRIYTKEGSNTNIIIVVFNSFR